jgi:hypothetical protein
MIIMDNSYYVRSTLFRSNDTTIEMVDTFRNLNLSAPKESETGRKIAHHLQNLQRLSNRNATQFSARWLLIGLALLFADIILGITLIFNSRVWNYATGMRVFYSFCGLAVIAVPFILYSKHISKKQEALDHIITELHDRFSLEVDPQLIVKHLSQFQVFNHREQQLILNDLERVEPCSKEEGHCLSPRHAHRIVVLKTPS